MAACKFNDFDTENGDWTAYSERLDQFFLANKIEEEKMKVAVLLSSLNESTYKLIRDLTHPLLPKEKKFVELTTLLKQQYGPRVNVWRERRKFYELRQNAYETVVEWIARIKKAAVNCEFEAQFEQIVKDKFITGINAGPLFERLAEEKSTTKLEELVDISLRKEVTIREKMEERREGESAVVHHVHSNNRSNTQRTKPMSRSNGQMSTNNQNNKGSTFFKKSDNFKDMQRSNCKHCGRTHTGVCKYKDFKCNSCGFKGHLERI